MSKINDLLDEAEAKVQLLKWDIGKPSEGTHDMTGKTVIVDDPEVLFDALKGLKQFPAIVIVYEGMRSKKEAGETAKVGISGEVSVALILVERDSAIHATDEKRTRSINLLEGMRNGFLGKRSTVTQHYWHFNVEAAAALKKGTVVWVQRWDVPIQLPPAPW